jgi:transposase
LPRRELGTADRRTAAGEESSETVLLTKTRLKEKLAKLEEEVKRLAALEKALLASPDKQISLTDPDCRSIATSGRGSGMVAYNMQSSSVGACLGLTPRRNQSGEGP